MISKVTRMGATLLFTLLCLQGALAQGTDHITPPGSETVPNQFIIKLSEAAESGTESQVLKLLSRYGIEILDVLPPSGVYLIRLSVTPTVEEIRSLNNDPQIEYFEPVYKVRTFREPNDEHYEKQWGFRQINAPRGWIRKTDAKEVVVAVIDTGIDYTHPDLLANLWKNPGEKPKNGKDDDGNGIVDDVLGANFSGEGEAHDPMDEEGHGTHVAGIIGAVSDNKIGVAGTAWRVQMMAIKSFGADGSGTTATSGQAVYYAIDKNADIINASWGGGQRSQYLKNAIRAANDASILFVAAAGNDGANGANNDEVPFYPANYDVPNVISVMASTKEGRKWSSSNFGRNTVDIAAPGSGIYSTYLEKRYAFMAGTSMAAPFVAGAAALVVARFGKSFLAPSDMRQHLIRSTSDFTYCKKKKC